jgi:hypothetical protein
LANDMLQQRRVARVVEKHTRLRTSKPRCDPDGREARHACYKAVIAWQFASPLGAGNRVRLPVCVVAAIRKLFPNPVCYPPPAGKCDYGTECERRGHYTGFRTADESRAIREGTYIGVDVQ